MNERGAELIPGRLVMSAAPRDFFYKFRPNIRYQLVLVSQLELHDGVVYFFLFILCQFGT